MTKPKPKKPQKDKRTHVPESVQAAAIEAEEGWPDDAGLPDDPAAYPLSSPKQERFAQEIASGTPLHDAYLKAGYTGNPSNARRLRADDAVWKRIGALQREIGRRVVENTAAAIKALGYDREAAFKEAGTAMGLALALGQGSAAVAAVKLRAEIAGLKLGEPPTELPADQHVAKDLEDPRIVESLANIRRVRGMIVVDGDKKAKG